MNRAPHKDQIRQIVESYNLDHKQAKRMLRKHGSALVPTRVSSKWNAVQVLKGMGLKQGTDFFVSHLPTSAGYVFADKSAATMIKMMDNL